MSALLERLAAKSGVAPLAVSGLQLVPRGAVALAEHVNRYYRVLTGADPQNVAIRLPTGGGSFRVLNSATGANVFLVTDAGVDVLPGSIDTGELTDGAVTSAKIADGSIVDADVNASAGIAVTKLAHVGAGNILRSTGVANSASQLINTDVSPAAAIAVTKLAALGDGNVLKGAGGVNTAAQVVDADVSASAGIAVTKLAHVGAGNVLKSNGTANVGGQVVSGDIADGTIMDADVNAAAAIAVTKVAHVGAGNVLKSTGTANVGGKVATGDMAANSINGDRILDASITSAKLTGASVPAGSITTTEIANNTIMDADVNAAAGILVSKLLGVGPNQVLAVGGSTPAAWQQVATAMLAGEAATQIRYGGISAGGGYSSGSYVALAMSPACTITPLAGSVWVIAFGTLQHTVAGNFVAIQMALDGSLFGLESISTISSASGYASFCWIGVTNPSLGVAHTFTPYIRTSAATAGIGGGAMFAFELKR